jgi:hypothetical protein
LGAVNQRPAEKPVTVCDDVRTVLGNESVEANLKVIRTRTVSCRLCAESVRPESAEPLTLSVVTFAPDANGTLEVEVVVTHEKCAPSQVAAVAGPRKVNPDLEADPPALVFTRPAGTRAALIFERGVVRKGRTEMHGESRDSWISTCLAGGLHLMTEPLFEFEQDSEGWLMTVDDPALGFVIRGPKGGGLTGRWPIPPEWLAVANEQRRCLLITGTALLSRDLYVAPGGPDFNVACQQLEEARLDGRMVGGVIEMANLRPEESKAGFFRLPGVGLQN